MSTSARKFKPSRKWRAAGSHASRACGRAHFVPETQVGKFAARAENLAEWKRWAGPGRRVRASLLAFEAGELAGGRQEHRKKGKLANAPRGIMIMTSDVGRY